MKCELDPITRPTCPVRIKALCFIDRVIMVGEEEESRWTLPLVNGLFQLVSISVGDGKGA